LQLWADGEEVIRGRRLVERTPLLWRHRKSPPMPEGLLVFASIANDGSKCDQAGLGWTHLLWWLSASDLSGPDAIEVTVT